MKWYFSEINISLQSINSPTMNFLYDLDFLLIRGTVDERFSEACNISNITRMDAIRVRFIPISSSTVLVRCWCSVVRMVAGDLGVREESRTTGVDQGGAKWKL